MTRGVLAMAKALLRRRERVEGEGRKVREVGAFTSKYFDILRGLIMVNMDVTNKSKNKMIKINNK